MAKLASESERPRRQCRKRSAVLDIELFQSPSTRASAQKKRKVEEGRRKVASKPRLLPISICDLPYLALHQMFSFLPVDDVENLALTNQFFQDLICEGFTTSADVPFSKQVVRDLESKPIFEKKPLLKLRCKDESVLTVGRLDRREAKYFIKFQLSFLDFSRLRELDLVPATDSLDTYEYNHVDCRNVFNELLLQNIHRRGTLGQLEVFDVLVNEVSENVLDYLKHMTKLRDFGLHVITSANLRGHLFTDQYVPLLERTVAASKASVLRLNILRETTRRQVKNLRSNNIERVIYSGPCSFNGALMMRKLKTVEINFGAACSHPKAPPPLELPLDISVDSDYSPTHPIHMPGLCGLTAASLYDGCPNIQEFAGVSLKGVDPNDPFGKWSSKIRKKFYKEWCRTSDRHQVIDFKDWTKGRWFKVRYPRKTQKKVNN